MFDFWRNLTKSSKERQQELLNAYLDGALSSKQRQRFEEQLAQDKRLQAELAQLRLLKQNLRRLPRRPVPRNFTLDPALYGRPQRQPLVQAYPALRFATILTAFFFILALGINLFTMDQRAASVALLSEPSAPGETTAAFSTESVEVTDEVANGVGDELTEAARQLTTEVPPEAQIEEAVEEEAADAEEEAATDEVQSTLSIMATTAPTEPAGEVTPVTDGLPATPTTSALPRSTPAPELAEDRAAAPSAVGQDEESGVIEQTEVDDGEAVSETGGLTALGSLRLLQIVLGLTFVTLAVLTLLARRRL